ncbi:MAG: hypothetical protein CMO12_04750 [Thaumarchaeota archaeon]|jgi:cyclopropane fatty-acyl-phospholipid synthase-like methyltransferase|nr:hypothetical protein [Nitrososphaerota archaeon]|tara:strand:+ start:3354 stop:4355 length:1002 start_codon:yes stop_codon:yes gene_type:complete
MTISGKDLSDILEGYRRAMLLMTANQYDLFTILRTKGMSAEEVALRSKTHPRPTEAVLNACVGMGLLSKNRSQFTCSEAARIYLLKGEQKYRGNFIKMHQEFYEYWARLPSLLKLNKPVVKTPSDHYEEDPAFAARLVKGLNDGARDQARLVAAELDLPKGPIRLLDLGGGGGAYSIALAKRYRNLRAVVFDLPPIIDVTKTIIAQSPLKNRITVQAGDYFQDKWGSRYDVVLISKVLRTEGIRTKKMIIRKACKALRKGGVIAVHDTMLDSTKTSPPESAIQNISMMLMYPEGGFFSLSELKTWLIGAGFKNTRIHDIQNPERLSLVSAQKT